jgi:hypothetical protein
MKTRYYDKKDVLKAKIIISFSGTILMIILGNILIRHFTVVCIKVHKIASVWCKTALGKVGVSLP